LETETFKENVGIPQNQHHNRKGKEEPAVFKKS